MVGRGSEEVRERWGESKNQTKNADCRMLHRESERVNYKTVRVKRNQQHTAKAKRDVALESKCRALMKIRDEVDFCTEESRKTCVA